MRRFVTCLAVVVLGVAACSGEASPGTDDRDSAADAVEETEPEPEVLDQEEPDPEPEPELGPVVEEPKSLRIGVVDGTTSGLPDLEVWVRGTGSWFPDTTFGGDVLDEAGPFPVGEPMTFSIYPEGRSGSEFAVTIELGDEIIEASVRDMIEITITDSIVEVFGTSIDGFVVEFDR